MAAPAPAETELDFASPCVNERSLLSNAATSFGFHTPGEGFDTPGARFPAPVERSEQTAENENFLEVEESGLELEKQFHFGTRSGGPPPPVEDDATRTPHHDLHSALKQQKQEACSGPPDCPEPPPATGSGADGLGNDIDALTMPRAGGELHKKEPVHVVHQGKQDEDGYNYVYEDPQKLYTTTKPQPLVSPPPSVVIVAASSFTQGHTSDELPEDGVVYPGIATGSTRHDQDQCDSATSEAGCNTNTRSTSRGGGLLAEEFSEGEIDCYEEDGCSAVPLVAPDLSCEPRNDTNSSTSCSTSDCSLGKMAMGMVVPKIAVIPAPACETAFPIEAAYRSSAAAFDEAVASLVSEGDVLQQDEVDLDVRQEEQIQEQSPVQPSVRSSSHVLASEASFSAEKVGSRSPHPDWDWDSTGGKKMRVVSCNSKLKGNSYGGYDLHGSRSYCEASVSTQQPSTTSTQNPMISPNSGSMISPFDPLVTDQLAALSAPKLEQQTLSASASGCTTSTGSCAGAHVTTGCVSLSASSCCPGAAPGATNVGNFELLGKVYEYNRQPLLLHAAGTEPRLLHAAQEQELPRVISERAASETRSWAWPKMLPWSTLGKENNGSTKREESAPCHPTRRNTTTNKRLLFQTAHVQMPLAAAAQKSTRIAQFPQILHQPAITAPLRADPWRRPSAQVQPQLRGASASAQRVFPPITPVPPNLHRVAPAPAADVGTPLFSQFLGRSSAPNCKRALSLDVQAPSTSSLWQLSSSLAMRSGARSPSVVKQEQQDQEATARNQDREKTQHLSCTGAVKSSAALYAGGRTLASRGQPPPRTRSSCNYYRSSGPEPPPRYVVSSKRNASSTSREPSLKRGVCYWHRTASRTRAQPRRALAGAGGASVPLALLNCPLQPLPKPTLGTSVQVNKNFLPPARSSTSSEARAVAVSTTDAGVVTPQPFKLMSQWKRASPASWSLSNNGPSPASNCNPFASSPDDAETMLESSAQKSRNRNAPCVAAQNLVVTPLEVAVDGQHQHHQRHTSESQATSSSKNYSSTSTSHCTVKIPQTSTASRSSTSFRAWRTSGRSPRGRTSGSRSLLGADVAVAGTFTTTTSKSSCSGSGPEEINQVSAATSTSTSSCNITAAANSMGIGITNSTSTNSTSTMMSVPIVTRAAPGGATTTRRTTMMMMSSLLPLRTTVGQRFRQLNFQAPSIPMNVGTHHFEFAPRAARPSP